MLKFLDIILFISHLVIMGFNLIGWIWQKTRRLHLFVVVATLFSWLGLGLWYGLGYCFLTDWEWNIKRALGERNLPHSFTQYLSDNVFGLYLNTRLVDVLTVGFFILAILLALWVNFIKPVFNLKNSKGGKLRGFL